MERRIQRQSDVKKKLMSQATHLASYQTTNATFTYRQFFFIVIYFLAVDLEISRYQDKALHNKRLIVLYILNAKNLAPLSISLFSVSKLITSNFSVIQMMCPCRKIIFVTNSNAQECLGIQRHFFGEKCQNIDFWHKPFLK